MATRPAHRTRRVPIDRAADFDEQLWPVNAAIIILAGFLVGIICSQGSFDPAETAFFENAYIHLGIVALLIGTLVWAVTWLQGKIVRRVQLCVLFSVLVHLGLAVYLHGQYLQLVLIEDSASDLQAAVRDEPITVPDYPWHFPDQPQDVESFERPVETETPEPAEVEPIERQPTEAEAAVDRPAPLEPEKPEPDQPDPAELERAERPPPERLDEPEPIDRRQPDHRPEPDEPVDLPKIPSPETEPPPPVDLQPAPVVAERRQDLPEAVRQVAESLPMRTQVASPELTRRTNASEGPLPELDLPASEPVTLARADTEFDLPSATTTVEDVTVPAAAGATPPSRIDVTSTDAAVERSDDRALRRASTAAAGAAEYALGSSPIVARVGEPRAIGTSAPSVGPTDPARRIARAPIGPSAPAAPSLKVAEVPAIAEARGGGGPSTVSPDARTTPVGQAGGVGLPRPGRAVVAGSGLSQTPGSFGPIEAAPLARVIGRPALPAVQAGGGVPMPARRQGRGFASGATVEVPPVAPGPPRGGVATGPPLEAQPSGEERPIAGLPGSLEGRPRAGALESLALRGPSLPNSAARRATAGQEAPGRVGTSPANAATLVKARAGLRLPAAAVPVDNVPLPGAGGVRAPQGAEPSSLAGDPSTPRAPLAPGPTEVSRVVGPTAPSHPLAPRRAGTAPASAAPALGSGDVIPELSPRMGTAGRPARPERDLALASIRPSVSRRSGRLPVLDARVPEPAEAFQQRLPERRHETAKKHGATEGSERAVERGLDFLARHQFADGHWSLHAFPAGGPAYADAVPGQMQADTAATGLSLLAFLGAGYTHMDNKHREVVRRGLDWLVAKQQPDGQLFARATDSDRPARSYGHAIGTIALCEAYGMTGDAALRRPAAMAIRWIINAQHAERGGWRYTQADDAPVWNKESDTSVSGWMLMALKSARMAELEVPSDVMRKVEHWLNLAQADRGARYMYNPYAGSSPEQRKGRIPNLPMTAEGLLMRLYLGWNRDQIAMIRGADYLKQNLPQLGARDQSLRDAYYWYYATQVMFQMQGDHWAAWNGRLRPMLVQSQITEGPLAGSWDPERPVPDRWSSSAGQIYVTTLNLLMLEVYYRYLPLYKTLVDEGATGSS